MAAGDIKKQLLEVSQDYLGPATERFIERQISTHLHKRPENISTADVNTLIDWLKLSFSLLTKDMALVEEYVTRLKFIADGQPEKALGEEWQR